MKEKTIEDTKEVLDKNDNLEKNKKIEKFFKRTGIGFVYLGFILSLILINNITYVTIAVMMLSGICLVEYLQVVEVKEKAYYYIGFVLILVLGGTTYFVKEGLTKYFFLIATGLLFTSFIYMLINYDNAEFKNLALSFTGYFYTAFLLTYITKIFMLKNGNIYFFILMSIVIGTDTFAYIMGSLFGKNKLTKISPKKTVEGSLFGTITACLVAYLIYKYILSVKFNVQFTNMYVLVVSIILVSIISQIGDLIASVIKRKYNKKDFGKIMLAHGGMIDRLDSLLLAAPVMYYLLKFFLI